MSLSPTKRRAEQFADLLEQHDRTDDPTLAPLVALSAALQSTPAIEGPAPEFRTALRQRLVAVATVQGVGETGSVGSRVRESASAWRVQRRLAVVAGGAAAVTAVAGVGIGASRALPGDAFYGLKRADEGVQLALARGDEAKGKKHLEFAQTRLSEVKALAARGDALPALVPGQPGAAALPQSGDSRIADTLRAMDEQTRAGATDLFLAYQHSGSTEPLQALNEFTVKQYADLMALLPALPADLQPPAKRSLALLRIVATDTRDLAPHRSSSGQPGSSGTHSTGRHKKSPNSSTSTPTPTPTTVTSSPGGSTGTKQTQPGTGVPTIPAVPTVGPLPTDLPTTLPPLPDVGSLLSTG
ncbi:MAG TPA: DUF5667 domain-containing protein [Mycobacteriales bacterium]|nr:DUF5667 domain-containing protein [Mycobacteriales bacterium]HET7309943.1 DUF5667 domain-containing protein [Mycobacteriales bacterium]